jgi:hypothetical protein
MGEPTRQYAQIGKAMGLVQCGLHHRILQRNRYQLLEPNGCHALGKAAGQKM